MKNYKDNEQYQSQIPALQLLINLGYEYIPPSEALKLRHGKKSNVILEEILRTKLKEINRINYRNKEYLFSEENIQTAIQELKNVKYEGLLQTNEKIYDFLTLGKAMEQTIEGDNKSFNLKYIDWKNIKRNSYHVTAEFSVEKTSSDETCRPDIVLFVNGIPLSVIECKAPEVKIEKAVSQTIRNQKKDHIPGLFIYSQILLALNKTEGKYATCGTPAEFWGIWKEDHGRNNKLEKLVNRVLDEKDKDLLFTEEFAHARRYFDGIEIEGERLTTGQDRLIYSLCSPERFMELIHRFMVYDNGEKKIARYQQYFVIKSTLKRIMKTGSDGVRKGGIIWHTQGSGKSLTMVMLVRNLAFSTEIKNPRIMLITDRTDLDNQLKNTFVSCGLEAEQAKSGKHLIDLVFNRKTDVVTSLIHKFDKAIKYKNNIEESGNIFMLVDESHRTNYGSLSARMRQMFPNACYIGFTGTPLLKREKSSFLKFGNLIDPHYSIRQAVEDKAVVPLLYEGRHVLMEQNKVAVDLWFERHTAELTKEQKADLKRKYARAEMLNKAEQVVYTRAFDISEHFSGNWGGTGFKAQLVAPGKATAIKYHQFMREIGKVRSAVIISPPDTREGNEDVFESSSKDKDKELVNSFWQSMMEKYGNEEKYSQSLINSFKNGDKPEIIIVVDKLLTGFDAPRNTVLYICRTLKEHTLLQAIARVNRLYENKETGLRKEFGYIVDYVSILGELDTALTMYDAFTGFDEADIEGTLKAVKEETEKIALYHSELWVLFKDIKNRTDEEEFELLLWKQDIRDEFYKRFRKFGKCFEMALSSEDFMMNTEEKLLNIYKNDYRRFGKLRKSVKNRYAETIDYGEYEPKIRKLLDTHIQASETVQLNVPCNVFDDEQADKVKEELGVYGKGKHGSKADEIAHRTKKTIEVEMDKDPVFYRRFSKLIQDVIDDYHEKRISELEYLNKVQEYEMKVLSRQHEEVPEKLENNEQAMAYFGSVKSYFEERKKIVDEEEIFTEFSLFVCELIDRHWKINFFDDEDAKKSFIDELDDYLYDEIKGKNAIELSLEEMDEIIEGVMKIFSRRNNS